MPANIIQSAPVFLSEEAPKVPVLPLLVKHTPVGNFVEVQSVKVLAFPPKPIKTALTADSCAPRPRDRAAQSLSGPKPVTLSETPVSSSGVSPLAPSAPRSKNSSSTFLSAHESSSAVKAVSFAPLSTVIPSSRRARSRSPDTSRKRARSRDDDDDDADDEDEAPVMTNLVPKPPGSVGSRKSKDSYTVPGQLIDDHGWNAKEFQSMKVSDQCVVILLSTDYNTRN